MPFNLNFKKILLVLGFLIIVVGLGFAIYFAFFRPEKEKIAQVEVEGAVGGGGLPVAGTGGIKSTSTAAATKGGLTAAATKKVTDLTSNAANDITLSSDGSSMQYYDSASGLFYKIDENGNLTPLSSKKFFDVEDVTWSGDSEKAVLEYPDGSNIVYDFSSGEQTTLPNHWEDFEFSPDDKKIINKSMGSDVENRWLVISDTDGTNNKIISALGNNADKVQVAWSSNDQVVGFSRTGDPTSAFGTQEVYLLGKNQENFRSLKVNGFNFKAAWAKEGDRLLYSVTDTDNDYLPTLWVVDASGDSIGKNTVKVGLNTWVDKCVVISGYKAYCAVPKELDEGAGLDISSATDSEDAFYFVNLKTGKTSLVGEPDTAYSVKQISVDKNEDYIYFTDNSSGALHKIKINQ